MAMSYWKISANLMSLGGLAIAIGMMVDGSVVMMENIFKYLNYLLVTIILVEMVSLMRVVPFVLYDMQQI
jgi:Cu/Ag efflux pump CusA